MGLSPDDTPVRDSMQQLGFNLFQNEAIHSQATHNYLYLPIINTFTLGMYGRVVPATAPSESDAAAQTQADDSAPSAETETAKNAPSSTQQ